MPSSLISERRAERWALLVLLAFTVAAVAGYWNFALHPERLPPTPAARQFFAISFQFFGRLHIAVSALALAVVLVGRSGARWVPALAGAYAVAFLAEHLGTGYGIPFGGYEYTGLLGYKLGGRVPALIPLSWFLMGLPAWVVARAAFPGSSARRIGVAALTLVAWDLALDPAMSFLTPYWIWQDTGPYYGMPWVNLAGWFLTGLAIMALLELLGGSMRPEELPVRWMGAYFLLVLLMPAGMLAAAGHWPAVAATAVGVGACAWMVRAAWRVAPADTTAVEVPGQMAAAGEPEQGATADRVLVGAP